MRFVATWVEQLDNGDCLITVWVVPGASRTQVVGEHGDALKVKVASPPEGGRANRVLLDLIGRMSGTTATLERGTTGRRKVVRVERIDRDRLVCALAAH